MKTKYNIRLANEQDIHNILLVMDEAKKIMRSSGNLHQWSDGYPSADIIRHDIALGGGYVIEEAFRIVGYFLPLTQHMLLSTMENGLRSLSPIMSFSVLQVYPMLTVSSKAPWISASKLIQIYVLILIAIIPSCNIIYRSMALLIAVLSIWKMAMND